MQDIHCIMQDLSLWHVGSVVMVCRLCCSIACGILVPLPGIEPTSPALQGRFLITGPPGKSWPMTIKMRFWWDILLTLISHTHHHQGRRPESPSAFTILGIENISRVNLLGFFRTGMRMKYPAPCLVVLK